MRRFFCCLAVLTAIVVPASGDIQQLYNTGVKLNGEGLLPAGASDPHYTVTGPGLTGSSALVINPDWPMSTGPGPWYPNTTVSQWVGPRADAGNGNPPQPGGSNDCASTCTYDYQTQFLSTTGGYTTLRGFWTSDNALVDVKIDGKSTGNHTGDALTDTQTYRNFSAFIITTNLTAGLHTHTIDFLVNNWGDANYGSPNPTGIQVEFVPEPDTVVLIGLMGAVLLGLTGVLKRKLA